ncbi:MAG: methionine--tRNA ligase [Candidatus Hydrogenedentes bacterium]|nr:methionine--tRNA ligase [Candidatus Hydrogenedentota bacterium]
MSKTAFVSTSIPYVNARPHIGFAFEIVQADTIARYLRLTGHDTFFITGTDENSLKNVRAARDEGITTRELCDRNSTAFQGLLGPLNISASDFIRTSSDVHVRGAQALWSRCRPEDIYRKHYTGLYCVGCEDFYTEKEAPNRICPSHGAALEIVEEENYFFRLSAYQDRLLELIESGRLRVVPVSRQNEMLAFIRGGLQDFSISRSRERAGDWGIHVPGDGSQVIYVWYDALANYVTSLDLRDGSERLNKYWLNCTRKIHVIGKDINRFHSIYWPAILLSAGLPTPETVFVHGFITINGQKISKSLGNVIDPLVQVERFGVDPVRYYLLRAISPFEDGDFSEERFRDVYNADLANNLGNLARRIETIGEKAHYAPPVWTTVLDAPEGYHAAMAEYRLNDALATLWDIATELNGRIEVAKPWELQKAGKDAALREFLDLAVSDLRCIAHWLSPFLPDTGDTLKEAFGNKELRRGDPLFPRLT